MQILDRKKLVRIMAGLPIIHTPGLMDSGVCPNVDTMLFERLEPLSVIQNPNGMTNRQRRKHEKTRKRKGRK